MPKNKLTKEAIAHWFYRWMMEMPRNEQRGVSKAKQKQGNMHTVRNRQLLFLRRYNEEIELGELNTHKIKDKIRTTNVMREKLIRK